MYSSISETIRQRSFSLLQTNKFTLREHKQLSRSNLPLVQEYIFMILVHTHQMKKHMFNFWVHRPQDK